MSKLVEYLFMENESRLARLVHKNTVPKRISFNLGNNDFVISFKQPEYTMK